MKQQLYEMNISLQIYKYVNYFLYQLTYGYFPIMEKNPTNSLKKKKKRFLSYIYTRCCWPYVAVDPHPHSIYTNSSPATRGRVDQYIYIHCPLKKRALTPWRSLILKSTFSHLFLFNLKPSIISPTL